MRFWALATVVCCAMVSTVWAEATPRDRAPTVDLVVTRQTKFTIPFEIFAAQDPANDPIEVILYVSADQGANWRLEGRLAPPAADTDSKRKGGFAFRAPYDGEYWFVIRTVDRQNRLHPDNNTKPPPELRVMVDTVPPRLDVNATRGANGEIHVRFQAVDPNLKSESLHVEYQAGNGPWRRVAIDPPVGAADRGARVGEAIFWPDDVVNPITVRGEIFDRAGNPAASQVTVQPDHPAAPPGVTRGHTDLTATVAPRNVMPVAQVTPLESKPSAATVAASAAPAASGGSIWQPPVAIANPAPNSNPFTKPSAVVAATSGPPATELLARRESSEPRGPELFPAVPSGTSPPIRSQYTPPRDVSAPILPPGERPWMVNRGTFELEYDTEGVGPSGVGKVQMWGTRDGGRTWASFGEDADKRSPIQVTVPGEGIYGFRIIVQNNAGQGGTPPQSGDLPEIWVDVDLTKPQAAIKNIEMGSGEHVGQLVIRWEASDAHLSPRPITLSFTDRPGGSWSTILAGAENSGVYYWRLDSRMPASVLLKLDVCDEAGNVTSVQTPAAVQLSRDAPKARLRGVKPTS